MIGFVETCCVKPGTDDLVAHSLTSEQRHMCDALGRQVHDEVMQAMHVMKGHQLDLLEVCSPWDSPLGVEVEKLGGSVMRLGVHNGYDLSTKEGFRRAAKVLRELRPRHVHFSPPCFPWSIMQNLNQRTSEQIKALGEKQRVGRRVLENLLKLGEIQFLELRGDFSGEQPLSASSWKEKPWNKLMKLAGGRFRVDGCRFHMTHPQNGMLVQKAWGFFSTKVDVRRRLTKTCNHSPCQHAQIEGSATAKSAVYPRLLCLAFAHAIMSVDQEFQEIVRFVTRANQEWVSERPGDEQPETQQMGETFVAAVQGRGEGDVTEHEHEHVPDLSHVQKELLRRMHRNLGHPAPAVMQRMLRWAGARPEVIKAAGDFECDICRRQALRKPVLPACPMTVTEKWHTVSVDTWWWQHPQKGADGNERHCLGISYMDEATDLHVACIVREGTHAPGSCSSAEFKSSFMKDWLRCLPKPVVLRMDVEGCFRGHDVVQWLEQEMMIRVDYIPGEAPWHMGKHSRHLHTLKTQMSKLADERPDLSMQETLALAVSAKNELHHKKGFSPNQWAFGQNTDRTFSFLNCYDHLPSMRSDDPSFQENMEVMARAREVFLECEAKNRIARAVNLKLRREQELEIGSLVFYFRKGKTRGYKVRGQWHGPGRIIFIEKSSTQDRGRLGSIIWVAHATALIRCAPEHVHPVTRDMQEVDTQVNGPHDLGAFMRDRKDYVDLIEERDQLGQEVVDDGDLAWHVDPNRLELSMEGSKSDGEPHKRRRLHGKQPIDPKDFERVTPEPPTRHVDGVRRESEASGPARDGGDRHQGLDGGRDEQVGLPQGQACEQDVRMDLDERWRLHHLVRGTHEADRAQQGSPGVHRQEDSRYREEDQGNEPVVGDRHSGRLVEPGRSRDHRPEAGAGVSPSENRGRRDQGGDAQVPGRDGAPDPPARRGDPGDVRADAAVRDRPEQERDQHVRGRNERSRTPPPRNLEHDSIFFANELLVCEISLHVGPRDVHYSKHEKQQDWVVNGKAKKGAEVNLRNLNDSEKEEFRKAKQKELDSYLGAMAVDIAKRKGVDPQRILGMRWVLTWKPEVDNDGKAIGRKAKARLIIKGFEDPDLLTIQRDSPTLSTLNRNLLLSQAAQHGWGVQVGDIKTAFLNGDPTEFEREIYGEPPDDVRDLLGLKERELFRIRKAVYGLLNAPRRWFEKLAKELLRLGWMRSRLEPCVWRMFDQGKLIGLLGVHVDDVLICGHGSLFESQVEKLRNTFPFGSWKDARKETVVFCGAELRQEPDGTIHLNQEAYALGINEINLSRERKLEEDAPASDGEKRAMKGLLGAVSWRANQTAPWLSATTSLLQGRNSNARVSDLLAANKLCRLQRAKADVGLTFCASISSPLYLTFTDASHANREDGTSQGGTLTVVTDRKVLSGLDAPFSVLSWHSRKLRRIARSSTCAEVQACANGYDDNEFIRQVVFEWQNEGGISARDSDTAVATIPAAVVCDAKNMYDAVNRIMSSGLQLGEEKRLSLEILSIRERSVETNAPLKWVDSDQQIADDLSKAFCVDKLLDAMQKGRLMIAWDPECVSAKRKRRARWNARHQEAVDSREHVSDPVRAKKESDRCNSGHDS